MNAHLIQPGEWAQVTIRPKPKPDNTRELQDPEIFVGKVMAEASWGFRIHVHYYVEKRETWHKSPKGDYTSWDWTPVPVCEQGVQLVVPWVQVARMELAEACACWLSETGIAG